MEILGYTVPTIVIIIVVLKVIIPALQAAGKKQRPQAAASHPSPSPRPAASGGIPNPPVSTPATVAAAAQGDTVEAKLLQLKRLHEQGLITEEEFTKKRAEILSRL